MCNQRQGWWFISYPVTFIILLLAAVCGAPEAQCQATSTYLGGSDFDAGERVVVLPSGDVVIIGATASADFPETAGLNGPWGARAVVDVFLVRMTPDLGTITARVRVGGESYDQLNTATLTPSGDILIAGLTYSGDFPVTPGAFSSNISGEGDIFLAVLSADLATLHYATYVGGSSEDEPFDVVAGAGAVLVGGRTSSADFPVTPGAYDTTYNGGIEGDTDAVVFKLTPDLGQMICATFLGGAGGADRADGIGVSSDGSVKVAGQTQSDDFPLTPDAFDTVTDGSEGFVSGFSPALDELLFSSYLGGPSFDWCFDLEVAPSGNVVLCGESAGGGIPVTSGAYDPTHNGNYDAFVLKLTPDLRTVISGTYLGGAGIDIARNLALGPGESVAVTGYTYSSGFPLTPDAFDRSIWAPDGFISRFSPNLDQLCYSSYLGGAYYDLGRGVAVAGNGDVYVAGYTESSSFPVTDGAFDTTYNGEGDAFVFRELSTVSANVECVPAAGTLPFSCRICCTLTNNLPVKRQAAGRLDFRLASGEELTGWRSGHRVLDDLESWSSCWRLTLPALPGLVGANTMTLHVFDVTPSPFNQPPHVPSGDNNVHTCGVQGIAPLTPQAP